jgi:hypothetical protein
MLRPAALARMEKTKGPVPPMATAWGLMRRLRPDFTMDPGARRGRDGHEHEHHVRGETRRGRHEGPARLTRWGSYASRSATAGRGTGSGTARPADTRRAQSGGHRAPPTAESRRVLAQVSEWETWRRRNWAARYGLNILVANWMMGPGSPPVTTASSRRTCTTS